MSNVNGHCTTCAKPIGAPFRRHNSLGTIVEGCIDAAHNGQLSGASAAWHDRPVAIALRASWETHRARVFSAGRVNAQVHKTAAGRFFVASFHGTYYAALANKWAFHPTVYARTLEELEGNSNVRTYSSHAGAARVLRRDYG